VLTLRPTGLLPLVTDSLPMRRCRRRSTAADDAAVISAGRDPGINGALWDDVRDITAQQGTRERWKVRVRHAAVVPY
jgi:suppressor of ftsI